MAPIHVNDHPGAIATPKIKELIDAAEKLPKPGHGRVLTAPNVGNIRLWHDGTLGIETAYSDMLQCIYRSIGRPPAEAAASVSAAATHGQHALDGDRFRPGARRARPRRPDLPATDNASLMDGHGVSVPRPVLADVEARPTDRRRRVTRAGDAALAGRQLYARGANAR